MSVFSSFNINASGMTAQRYRMDIIAENVANAETTRTKDGSPYRRKMVTFEEKDSKTNFKHILSKSIDQYSGKGVKVHGVYEDTVQDFIKVYDPAHPDADENGYVLYPNVNIVQEMTDLIDTTRSYEANSTAFTASKAMAMKGLEIAE